MPKSLMAESITRKMKMNDNKFTLGLMIGLILGGGAVFFLGTRTGRNLLKILSERGMDGLTEILEEYNFDDLEEMEDEGGIPAEDISTQNSVDHHPETSQPEKKESTPKKHFFKRVKK